MRVRIRGQGRNLKRCAYPPNSRSVRVDRHSPNYGRGIVDVGTIDFVDEQAVKVRLLEVFRAPDYKPPTLPAVAMEVLGLSQQPNVSFADVGRVLERDGMIAGQVLKLAQSPMFAGQQRVTSINQAMVRLGLRTVRDLVVQVALETKVFRCRPYQPALESLRRHASAVAHLARIISKYTAFESEFAFLCGLLHDVGIAGALIALVEHAKPHPPPDILEVWPAVVAIHEEASELMAQNWSLPTDVSLVLGAHHRVTIQGYSHPMAAIIAMANDLSNNLGLGLTISKQDLTSEPALEAARRAELSAQLSLSESQLALIGADAEALKEHLESM